MRHIILLISLIMIGHSVYAKDLSSVEAELVAFNDRFNELVAAYDVEGLKALYAEDSLWIAPKTRPVLGKDGAASTFGFMKDKQGTNVHSIDRLEISADGTMAMMVGDAKIGVESMGLAFTGTYQFILRREGTDWKIISDMYNRHE